MSTFKIPVKQQSISGIAKKEITEGIEEEHEHTSNARLAKQIALDHLKDDKKYYTHLEAMETRYNGEREHTKKAYANGFMKAAGQSGIDITTAALMLKLAVEVHDDVPMYKRPISSTIGRIQSPLYALLMGNSAFVKPGPKKKDLEYLKNHYDSKKQDKGDIPLAVYPNRVRPWENLKRIWKRKKTSIPTKIWGTATTPISDLQAALNRGDHYNPFSHSVTSFANTPGVQLHEAGHAKDFSSRKYPGLYTLLRLLPPAMLYQEWKASNYAMKDMDNYVKGKPEKEQKKIKNTARRTLGGGFGSYIGSVLHPAGSIPGALIGQVVGHRNPQMFK